MPGLTAGELWAREQLGALRAGGVASAWRFLCAAWQRSAVTRAQRPQLVRRAHAWLTLGGVMWLGGALAGVAPLRRRLRGGLAWWGSTSAMLVWHLGMFETADGRPRQLGVADALTLARAWLVPVVADSPTVAVCAVAAATDAFDGPLARRAGPTRAGRDLEGLVDACFAMAALRGLTSRQLLGPGAAFAEASRLTAGAAYPTFCYLGRASAPELGLVRAARSASALRFAGLLAAASGRRRAGGALLASGSACSAVLTVRAARAARLAAAARTARRPRER